MLKFLRKYNKYILVVGGVLLMIAFTAPQLVQQLGPNPENAKVGKLGGRDVTAGELRLAGIHAEALRAYSPPLMFGLIGVAEADEHWFLLTQAAKRAGLVGGPDDGLAFIPDLANRMAILQLQQQGFPPDLAAQFAGQQAAQFIPQLEQSIPIAAAQYRMTEDEFLQVLADARGVVRMIDLYRQANRVSDRELASAIRTIEDRAFLDLLWLPAETFAPTIRDPRDDELLELFERFRDVQPGEGETGIGYILPPRARIETLELDRDLIASYIDPDPIEVRKRWSQRPESYNATTFELARPEIEEELRQETVERVLAEADRILRAQVLSATRRLDEQRGYKVLTDTWDAERPRFEDISGAIAEGVRESVGVDMAPPRVRPMSPQFLTLDLLAQDDAIGGATVRIGSETIPAAQVVLLVRESAGPNDQLIQTGIPAVEYKAIGQNGEVVYWTVLDARPESPPDTASQIRSRLVADWKRLQANTLLAGRSRQLLGIAASEGMLAALDHAEDEILGLNNTDGSLRVSRTVEVGELGIQGTDAQLNTEVLRDAVMERARALDPMVRGADIDPAVRLFTLPLERPMGLVIGDLIGFVPATRDDYQTGGLNGIEYARFIEFSDARGDDDFPPFSLEALAERMDYTGENLNDAIEQANEGEDASESADDGADESEA
ncbi:MAG: hypothetical protein AAGG07_05110 [Planctomycetota bacterium]